MSTLPPTLPPVAIVCVTYNRRDPLLVLLGQLRGLDYPADRVDIFLVDNASTDGTVEAVREHHPEVSLILSGENLGTSAGFNLGMRAALDSDRDHDLIWLLDSDAEIEPGTLKPVVAAMGAHPDVGIIGSTVYDPGQRERTVASGLHINWRSGMVSLNKPAAVADDELVDADLIPACSLIIRAGLCRRLGLWDERFWVYWGDTDWCQRVLREGYRVCSHPGSRAWHRDWANTRRNFNAPTVIYDDLRGGLLFNVRHNPEQSLAGARALLLKGYIKGALEHLTLRPNFSHACEAAARDFLNADFPRSSTYRGPETVDPVPLGILWDRLAPSLPPAPRVWLDQLPGELAARVGAHIRRHRPDAVITQHPRKQAGPQEDFTTDYGGYLKTELRQLVARLVRPRFDLLITDVGQPHLYTLVAARRTLMLDAGGAGVIRDNLRMQGLARMATMLLRGLKIAGFDLPRGLKRNARLQRAVSDYPLAAPVGVGGERAAV